MPIGGGVQVQGLRQLIRDLQAAGVEVTDLKDAFGRIANEAAGLAASFAPRRTGRLRSSIKGSRAKNYARVRAGTAARVPYAGPINYGWPAHRIRGSGFMQRADVLMRPRAVRDLEAAIDRLLRQKGFT